MKKKLAILLLSALIILGGCSNTSKENNTVDTSKTTTKKIETKEKRQTETVKKSRKNKKFREVSVHDPSVIKADDGTYYVFGSHLASAKSKDLMKWKQMTRMFRKGNKLFPDPFLEFSEALKWTKGESIWAPSPIKIDNKYYFYYSMSTWGSRRSIIGLAVSDNIEGPYKHEGTVIKSGRSIDRKFSFKSGIGPNAIDPHVYFDKEGKLWMVYGSYFGGIFVLELNSKTGMPLPNQGYGKRIIGGNHAAMEGPFVLYSPDSDYYYLFVSFGTLASNGGYNIRVARSKNPNGPFYDPSGNNVNNANKKGTVFIKSYGEKLAGNFTFIDDNGDATGGYVSSGHNSAYYDEELGKYFILFHTRFPGKGEGHQLRVHQFFINDEGWPVMAPHRYSGETIEKYASDEIIGNYSFVNHGNDSSSTIKKSKLIELRNNGEISGSIKGNWERKGDFGIKIIIDGTNYEGVLLKQWDSISEKEVMTFSAVSEVNNQSIWGSQLLGE